MSLRALFSHFREMKHYFIAATFVFITGMVLGYGYSEQFDRVLNSQLQGLENIAKAIGETKQPQLWLFVFIFFNNVIKSIFTVYTGLFFGIFPLFFLLINGMVLGYIGELQQGQWLFLAKGILPHGIIEIPAVIIASAYGIRLGTLMIKGIVSVASAERQEAFKREALRFLKLTIPLCVFLALSLFAAAVIESTFTMWLVGK